MWYDKTHIKIIRNLQIKRCKFGEHLFEKSKISTKVFTSCNKVYNKKSISCILGASAKYKTHLIFVYTKCLGMNIKFGYLHRILNIFQSFLLQIICQVYHVPPRLLSIKLIFQVATKVDDIVAGLEEKFQ